MLFQDQNRDVVTLEKALLGIASLGWQEDDVPQLEGLPSWGSFEGDLVVQFLNDGRLCKLIQRYAYLRPDGTEWIVPPGTIVDGASIPKLFWSLIGGPFEGRYRNASVVHDRYCDTRERPWRDTHRMFYEAMRCNGVQALKAKVMFYAVNRFGPRWPGAGELAPEAAVSEVTASDADARTLLADAEAIFTHDLGPDEIERLADARRDEGLSLEGPLGPVDAARLAQARSLVICGGSGDQSDLEAVASEVLLLPEFVLRAFEERRIRIVACRGAVTDFEKDLKGVTPPGWERTCSTWDSVIGAYFDDRRRVVIATAASSEGGGREVPGKASGRHSSDNLVVHMALHGYDYSGSHSALADPAFASACDADFAQPQEGRHGFFVQHAPVGREEAFAESGAAFAVDGPGMAARSPNLHAYWQALCLANCETPPPNSPMQSLPDELGHSLGSATILPAGDLCLDIRAEGPGGAIGHGIIDLAQDTHAYGQVIAHLLGGAPIPRLSGPVRLPYRA